MPDLTALNITSWPIWLVAVLVIINIFKQPLIGFLPGAIREHFRWRAERSDVQLNSRLQREATDDLRRSWREENWMQLLADKDAWILGELNKRLEAINTTGQAILEENNRIRGEIKRAANIQETIHISLSKMAEYQRQTNETLMRLVDREEAQRD